jgi:hypothetical protein
MEADVKMAAFEASGAEKWVWYLNWQRILMDFSRIHRLFLTIFPPKKGQNSWGPSSDTPRSGGIFVEYHPVTCTIDGANQTWDIIISASHICQSSSLPRIFLSSYNIVRLI